MNVLGVIHGDEVRAGVFAEVVEERGHALEEWSLAWDRPPPRPLDEYGAVFVFGGAMHADQDDRHPWLREEGLLIQRLLNLRVPLLGVCLGAQLLAKAAQATVGPAREPEIGWFPVELTPAAREDPLLGRLPARFPAFQWHYYTYGLPAGSVELARSELCSQAFRLGRAAWGIQFHAEVTERQIAGWIASSPGEIPGRQAELSAETAARIAEWNGLGRLLCEGFLGVAEASAAAQAA
jgi:GMP synthase-like glutamine amidotransferase